jgi:hypothetical protein
VERRRGLSRQLKYLGGGRGFEVIYVDPIHREFAAHTDVEEVVPRLSEAVADVTGYTPMRLADLAVYLAKQLLKKWKKRRITVLVDEVFQAIGVDRAEVYVKILLNMVEYPQNHTRGWWLLQPQARGLPELG